MPERFFVTGTDTGIGKTVVSALLTAAFKALYWKPIQTGTVEGTDRETVMQLAGIPADRTIPEAYSFAPPVSPHLAAKLAAKRIELQNIQRPRIAKTANLIVEGAGGVLVPINERKLMIDLIAQLGLPVVLVSRTTLGTINHTLLSIAVLRSKKLTIQGVIMSGEPNKENLAAIEKYGKVRVLGTLPKLAKLDKRALLRAFDRHFNRKDFAQ